MRRIRRHRAQFATVPGGTDHHLEGGRVRERQDAVLVQGAGGQDLLRAARHITGERRKLDDRPDDQANRDHSAERRGRNRHLEAKRLLPHPHGGVRKR